ncbi:MAG TPA: hypothetical protein VHB77_15965 [Planctomycetaceae bacterium]|nr:hypothetical protein [Planctomycetaceae bacterium]
MIAGFDKLADVPTEPATGNGPEQLGDILAQWWLQRGARRVPVEEAVAAQRGPRPRVTSACA